MPLRTVPGTDVDYHLVLFDEQGAERPETSGELLSAELRARASETTDIFVLSHGWKGDIPAAISQYDAWIGAMAARSDDRDRIRGLVPDFSSLVVGVHWPSLPWGVEDVDSALLGDEAESDDLAAEDALPSAELVDRYAQRLNDTPATRDALATILAAADDPDIESRLEADALPAELQAAYDTLFEQTGLGLDGALAAPGSDQPAFDPATTMREWPDAAPGTTAATSGEPLLLGWGDDLADRLAKVKKALLSPVRQLSFWTMKKRARTVGESGVHDLLRALQETAPGVRMHLMGHSFGCIVVSAAIAGPAGGPGLPRPVDAVLLVQGAMSLWSYAAEVPFPPYSSGYFRPLLEPTARIRGPLVTTLSSFDSAVRKYYPLGARAGDDLLLGDELPKFGGIGVFGIQGADATAVEIQSAHADYELVRGGIYNVDADTVIRNGSGASGAHSDIAHPEVAHLMWQAATAALR